MGIELKLYFLLLHLKSNKIAFSKLAAGYQHDNFKSQNIIIISPPH